MRHAPQDVPWTRAVHPYPTLLTRPVFPVRRKRTPGRGPSAAPLAGRARSWPEHPAPDKQTHRWPLDGQSRPAGPTVRSPAGPAAGGSARTILAGADPGWHRLLWESLATRRWARRPL